MARFGFEPSPAQLQVFSSPKRFKFLRAGRRFGKTMGAAALATTDMVMGKRVWWIAPQHSNALEGFYYVLSNLDRLVEHGLVYNKRTNPNLTIRLPQTGGLLEFKSTSKTATNLSLVGAGLDRIIVDEVARIRGFKRMWDFDLRPTLLDRKGEALFISTPYGKGDFYKIFKENEHEPSWAFWQFSSEDNPNLPPEELIEMRRRASGDVQAQELDANWIDSVGQYFPIIPEFSEVSPIIRKVYGYDYAPGTTRGCRWSIVTACQDRDAKIIALEEMGGYEPYEFQLKYLETITSAGGLIVADAHLPLKIKEDMMRKRIRFIDATVDREGSLLLLRTYCNLNLASIRHRNVNPNLFREMDEAIVDSDNPNDLYGDDDFLDAFRYAFDYLCDFTNPIHKIEKRAQWNNFLDVAQKNKWI